MIDEKISDEEKEMDIAYAKISAAEKNAAEEMLTKKY